MQTRTAKRRLAFGIVLLAAVLLNATDGAAGNPGADGPAKDEAWICNDYHSKVNCVGGRYLVRAGAQGHRGIDFGAPAGTEVISATHGKVVAKSFSECVGDQIVVKTAIWARKGQVHDHVYAVYAHTQPVESLALSQQVKPGDVIGRIIPLRKTECYGSREHVHFELRVSEAYGNDIDPNDFWVDGPGGVTCFKEGMSVPPDKVVAPVRCTTVRRK